jgi:hypothetical protein
MEGLFVFGLFWWNEAENEKKPPSYVILKVEHPELVSGDIMGKLERLRLNADSPLEGSVEGCLH